MWNDKTVKFVTLSTAIINESRRTEASTHTESGVGEGENRYRQRLIVITTPVISKRASRMYVWLLFVYILNCLFLKITLNSALKCHLLTWSSRNQLIENSFRFSAEVEVKSAAHDSAVRRTQLRYYAVCTLRENRERERERLKNNEATTSAGGC